jgi:DNA-binding MarR family transcriptional regulator
MKKDISQITTYESGVVQAAAHRLTMKIKTDYLSQYDLSVMQWFVIGFTYDAGIDGIRLSQLMKSLDTTMPFITNLVNTLELKGIINKVSDITDSRVKIAKLHPSYLSKVEEIETGLRETLRNELYRHDHITRDELSDYISVLYKIVQANKLGKD